MRSSISLFRKLVWPRQRTQQQRRESSTNYELNKGAERQILLKRPKGKINSLRPSAAASKLVTKKEIKPSNKAREVKITSTETTKLIINEL